jgi:hypothetical protein
MSGFKKLNRQDVFITSYTAKKNWSISSADFEDYGIRKLPGFSGSLPIYSSSLNFNQRALYESIKHLYYSNGVRGIEFEERPIIVSTPTPTPTSTPTPTLSSTPTPTPTSTQTPTPTSTLTSTLTPTLTSTPTPTETSTPTPTPTPTFTPAPSPDIQIVNYNVVLLGGD